MFAKFPSTVGKWLIAVGVVLFMLCFAIGFARAQGPAQHPCPKAQPVPKALQLPAKLRPVSRSSSRNRCSSI